MVPESSSYHSQTWSSIDTIADSLIRISKIGQAVSSTCTSGAGNKKSHKERLKVHTKTRNQLIDDKVGNQSFTAFNSGELERLNAALNKRCSTPFYCCFTNRLFGGIGKNFLLIFGPVDFEEKYCDATKDIHKFLINVVTFEKEFDSLFENGDD